MIERKIYKDTDYYDEDFENNGDICRISLCASDPGIRPPTPQDFVSQPEDAYGNVHPAKPEEFGYRELRITPMLEPLTAELKGALKWKSLIPAFGIKGTFEINGRNAIKDKINNYYKDVSVPEELDEALKRLDEKAPEYDLEWFSRPIINYVSRYENNYEEEDGKSVVVFRIPIHKKYGATFKVFADVDNEEKLQMAYEFFCKNKMNPTISGSLNGYRIYLALPNVFEEGLINLRGNFNDNYIFPYLRKKK